MNDCQNDVRLAISIATLIKSLLIFASAANFNIQCYGEDFLMVRNQLLSCNSKEKQACFTKGDLTPPIPNSLEIMH